MVPLLSLCVPILVSAVIVFVASSVIHMLLPYHRSDFKHVPAQDEVMAALGKFNLPPGDYMMPRPASPGAMRSPEYIAQRTKGPVAIFTVLKSGPPTMGPSLIQWFLYLIVVGFLTAYVTGRALGPGSSYLSVFRIAGATAFIAHAVGQWPASIWYQRSWATTFKNTVDGLVYGVLAAGTFGWLWPR